MNTLDQLKEAERKLEQVPQSFEIKQIMTTVKLLIGTLERGMPEARMKGNIERTLTKANKFIT